MYLVQKDNWFEIEHDTVDLQINTSGFSIEFSIWLLSCVQGTLVVSNVGLFYTQQINRYGRGKWWGVCCSCSCWLWFFFIVKKHLQYVAATHTNTDTCRFSRDFSSWWQSTLFQITIWSFIIKTQCAVLNESYEVAYSTYDRSKMHKLS